MKKFLLSAAAVTLAATSLFAEDPRVHETYAPAGELNGELSPKNFIGATATGLPTFTAPQKMDWQIPAYYIADTFITGDQEIGDGVIALSGPAVQSGADTPADFANGFNLVDLGGDCGKVIVINGNGSTLGNKLGEMGVNVELKNLKSLGGMPVMFWIPNPSSFQPLLQGKDDRVFRLSIEYNLYHNTPSDNQAWQNVYVNDDENNVPGGTNSDAGVDANMKNFWYTWCDKANDESPAEDWTDTTMWYDFDNGGTDTDDPVWNPERWMVTEFDFPLTAEDEKKGRWTYAPRLKWEFKPGFLNQGGAILIRGVYFSEVGTREPITPGARRETYNWYTMGDAAGVTTIATNDVTAPVEYFNLQGIRVSNPENGIFICRQGNKVTKIAK